MNTTERLQRDPHWHGHDTGLSVASLLSLTTRGETLPDFIDSALKEIDDQLRVAKRRGGAPGGGATALTTSTRGPVARREPAAPRPRIWRAGGSSRRSPTRASRCQPARESGARAGPREARNHDPRDRPGDEDRAQRSVPRAAATGVRRSRSRATARGWHPASSSTSTSGRGPCAASRHAKRSRRPPSPRRRGDDLRKTGREDSPRQRNRHRRPDRPRGADHGRGARGARRWRRDDRRPGGDEGRACASDRIDDAVETGRKSGEVQKAERGYRLTSAV